jgi:hypothetical protein
MIADRWLPRWGLALVAPRDALAAADARVLGGKPGLDLIGALLALVVVAHTRELAAAGWLLRDVGVRAGVAVAVSAVMAAATVPLVMVAVISAVTTAAAGRRRDLGRDIDLACVAVLPTVTAAMVVAAAESMVAVPRAVALVVVVAAAVPSLAWAIDVARHRRRRP